MQKILVINAGSSSIKMSLFIKDSLELLASGLVERIGLSQGNLTLKYKEQKFEKQAIMPNHLKAVEELYALMQESNLIKAKSEIEYIGFRIVQGGDEIKTTTKVNQEVIQIIEKYASYAPLHNPGALEAINAFKKIFPLAKLSADFDTAFHTTIAKVNYTYPIKKDLVKDLNIKKYGAHGISHEYITKKLQDILNKDKVTFINLHLGNGASLCAIKDSKSFDTSMGLTPLAGIMMGTRSGDIDPSIHEYVLKNTNLSISEFTNILNKESGLLGVSGISSDMRDIRAAASSGNEDALFTLDLYAQKIADYCAIYFNKLGAKLDALVFTAGIGENVAEIRQRIIDKLYFKNLVLSKEYNEGQINDYTLISDKLSEIPIYAIRTNEELVIAQNAIKIYN